MGVYNKGMEMPTSCYDCDFAYQDQDSEHNVYWTCAAVHKSACMHERREDCPLVPVPPHGDLIDRDALMKKLNNCMFPSDMVTTRAVSMAMNWLKESPTIIESEGDG